MKNVQQVDVYLGIDAHVQHCTLCAIDKNGKIIMRQNVPTNTKDLRDMAKKMPENTWAIIEASSVSILVHDALVRQLDNVVVCETRENRLIAKSGDKSDDKDAHRLARLLRMGEYKEVHVPKRPRQELREIVHGYQTAVSDVVRAKCRIRGKFARYGVGITDNAYGDGREDALKQLRRLGLKSVFEALYTVLDAAEEAKKDLGNALRARLARAREYKLLKTIPGIGPVCAAVMVAVIDCPKRFPDKRHLWSYAGIGASESSSGKGSVQTRGQKHGNRLLKYAAMTAAMCAIRGESRFAQLYQSMVEKNDDSKKMKRAAAMARKTAARAILATVLAMWKTGTAYRENSQVKSA